MSLFLTALYGMMLLLLCAVSLLVFLNKKDKKINFFIQLSLISVMGIIISIYCGYYFNVTNYVYSLWAMRGTFIFGFLYVHALLAISYYYPRQLYELSGRTISAVRIITLLLVLLSFTDLVYKGSYSSGEGMRDIHGSLHVVYLGAYFFYLFSALFSFWRKSFLLDGIERVKVRLIAVTALSLSFLTLLIYTILPKWDIYVFQQEAVLVSGILPLVMVYSMMKYRFLNVKIKISSVGRLFLSILITGSFLFGVSSLFEFVNLDSSSCAAHVSYLLLGASLFLYCYQEWVPDIIHELFGLTDFAHFEKVVSEIKDDMDFPVSVEDFEISLQEKFKEIQVDYLKIILINPSGRKSRNIRMGYAEKHREILVRSEVPYLKHKERWFNEQEIGEAAEMGELSIPLYASTDEILGFIILGKKRFGDLYTREEINKLSKMRIYLQLRVLGALYRQQLHKEVEIKTEQLRKRNEEMAYANQKLEALDEAKDQFLSIASHELRTPMTVINGFTDLLLSKNFGPLTEKQESFLNTIAQNSLDLRNFVHRMLDVAQLESDRMMFELQDIELKEFLAKVIDEYKVLTEKKNIVLDFVVEGEVDGIIEIDPGRMKEIVGNLIANAYKFTDEGGRIEVILSVCREPECLIKGEHVKIIVKDDGMGIEKAELPVIFDRFQQTKRSRKRAHSGTGLGLSIVKLLVDKFRGKIRVESEVGKGTTFMVCIPRKCSIENEKSIIKG